MKRGIVLLVGRPNAGKSTLLNNLLGHKVSITSPKPQTTRFDVQAVFEDERGQIVFIDTPGIFAKSEDILSKAINRRAEDAISSHIDLLLYIIDHTRERSFEENKSLGIVRKIHSPKILVINKTDVKKPSYIVQYRFMEEEFNETIEISALSHKNLNILMDRIFSYLPEGSPIVDTSKIAQPGLNMDSKLFIAEIIREKAFLFLRREVPYAITTVVDDIIEREDGTLYIKGRILTSADRYKSMIIGKNGSMIKEISMAARKEIETASTKKVYMDITVQTDTHWMEFV